MYFLCINVVVVVVVGHTFRSKQMMKERQICLLFSLSLLFLSLLLLFVIVIVVVVIIVVVVVVYCSFRSSHLI